jgi:hypothetical protein
MRDHGRRRGHVSSSPSTGAGGGYLYRPGELLVEERAVDAVLGRLMRSARRASGPPQRYPALGVVRLHLRGDEAQGPVPDLVRELRAAGLPVSPNHVLQAASHINIRPALPPEPAARLGPLPADGELPGRGVRVGVLDSGVWAGHPWLEGHVDAARTDAEADADGNPIDADTTADGPRLRYYSGHGTFIAGVILQHAPGASVVARRVFKGGAVDDVTLADQIVAMADVDVLNLSLGTRVDAELDDDDVHALMGTASSLIELARRNPKLVVVAPAGNDGEADEVWPAAFKAVVSVAALDDTGQSRAEFSNFGDWVDAGARGENVHSAFLRWNGRLEHPRQSGGHHDGHDHGSAAEAQDADTGAGDTEGRFDGWAHWSGTSFATPRVAAAVAARIGSGMEPAAAVEDVLAGDRRVEGCGVVVDPPSFAAPDDGGAGSS